MVQKLADKMAKLAQKSIDEYNQEIYDGWFKTGRYEELLQKIECAASNGVRSYLTNEVLPDCVLAKLEQEGFKIQQNNSLRTICPPHIISW